jgi:periplasmic divalent cation tolerance protein
VTSSANPVSVVLTTIGASADAAALARTLVEERLAACVNILPVMTSIYRWRGRIEVEPEQQLLIKTASNRVADLERRLKELHPYEVPEFLVLPAGDQGAAAYLAWVRESVEDAGPPPAPKL